MSGYTCTDMSPDRGSSPDASGRGTVSYLQDSSRPSSQAAGILFRSTNGGMPFAPTSRPSSAARSIRMGKNADDRASPDLSQRMGEFEQAESSPSVQNSWEPPSSPAAWSAYSASGHGEDTANGDTLSPLAASTGRSSRTYPSPMMLPQPAPLPGTVDGSPGRKPWKTWLRWPAGESEPAEVEDGIVRRASESAMGILSAYADAHTVCRRVSVLPWVLDPSAANSRLEPCHEDDSDEPESAQPA